MIYRPAQCGLRRKRRPRISRSGGASMFEGITRGLSDAFKKLRGHGRLSEANMQDGLREVQKALPEADVNFNVAKNFIKRVGEAAVGREVLRSIKPAEQIVSII